MAILGSSSMVTVIAGIASAKIAALLIGPSGVGLVGLVQGVTAVVAAIVELGLASAVVRAYGVGAPAGEAPALATLGLAARRTVLLVGAVAVVVVAGTSPFLTTAILGPDRSWFELTLAALAAVPVALTVVENGLMVAAHRVRAVARTAVSIAFVSPLVSLIAYSLFDEDGVAPGAVVSAVLIWSVTSWFRRRELRQLTAAESGDTSPRLAHRLLRDGVPVMASALIGAIAVLALPVIVEGRLGRDGVGFYRAANVISLGYTAAIVAVIGADFLPRVSRVMGDPVEVRRLIARQIDLLVVAFVPLLCLMGAVLPFIVTVLYRDDFGPTVTVLEWQLVGDLFRMGGSVLATAIFARFGGVHRLTWEIVGLVSLIGLSVLGLLVDGTRGLGWGFLASYVLYFAVLWIVLGMRSAGVEATRTVKMLGLGAVVTAVPPLAAQASGGDDRVRAVGIVLALAWAAVAFRHHRARRAH